MDRHKKKWRKKQFHNWLKNTHKQKKITGCLHWEHILQILFDNANGKNVLQTKKLQQKAIRQLYINESLLITCSWDRDRCFQDRKTCFRGKNRCFQNRIYVFEIWIDPFEIRIGCLWDRNRYFWDWSRCFRDIDRCFQNRIRCFQERNIRWMFPR